MLAETGQRAEIFTRSECSHNLTENAFHNERGYSLNPDKVEIITMSAHSKRNMNFTANDDARSSVS